MSSKNRGQAERFADYSSFLITWEAVLIIAEWYNSVHTLKLMKHNYNPLPLYNTFTIPLSLPQLQHLNHIKGPVIYVRCCFLTLHTNICWKCQEKNLNLKKMNKQPLTTLITMQQIHTTVCIRCHLTSLQCCSSK